MSDRKYPVVMIEWTESERGWGCRPDGISIHANNEVMKKYVEDYDKNLPAIVPHEYTRAESRYPKVIDIPQGAYDYLMARADKSLRLWQTEEKLIKEGKDPWADCHNKVVLTGKAHHYGILDQDGLSEKAAFERVEYLKSIGIAATIFDQQDRKITLKK